MARYIDADKLIEHILTLKVVTDNMYGMGIARGIERAETAIQMQPTADVVPKSEVDRAYERGFERGKKDNVCGFSAEEIAQKVEEIAIELEAMRMAANSYKMHYENARVEVAREIFEEIEELLKRTCEKGYCGSISDLLAELKKKYTEGEA